MCTVIIYKDKKSLWPFIVSFNRDEFFSRKTLIPKRHWKKHSYILAGKDFPPKKYYGEYPYYNLGFDNQLTRLQWIFSREDHGELYFKKIVKNISEKLNFDPIKIIQTNNSKLIKLQN